MRRIITLPILFICIFCNATEYYIKNGGSDSNSGLSDSDAWAHHPWMSIWEGERFVLLPGDKVFFNRGDIWSIKNPSEPYIFTKQSGNAENYILTSAYGKGEAPIIEIATNSPVPIIRIYGDSFLKFENLHLRHFSSEYINLQWYSGILITKEEQTIPHHIEIKNCEIHRVPWACIAGTDDSHHVIIGDTTEKAIATKRNFSNHLYDFGRTGILLSGCDEKGEMNSDFFIMHNFIHDATQTEPQGVAYGIIVTATEYSSAWPRQVIVRYNRVENIKTWEGIECHGGSYIYFIDNHVLGFGHVGIWAGGSEQIEALPATSHHIFIERNIVEQPLSSWITGRENAFILQSSVSNQTIPSHIFIRDNKCFYQARPSEDLFFGIRAGNVTGLEISGNEVMNGSLNSINERAGIYLTDNYGSFGIDKADISRNFIYEWGPGLVLAGNAVTGEILVSYNIISNPIGHANIRLTGSSVPSNGRLLIHNNVLIADSSYSRNFESVEGIEEGARVEAKNNIFGLFDPTEGYYWGWGGAIKGIFDCDYNLYWNSTYEKPFFVEGELYNWNRWIESGFDSHSIFNEDPLFDNSSGTFSKGLDYIIRNSSPVVDGGIDVGQSNDFVGDEIQGIPDIGAFELERVNSISKSQAIKLFPNPVGSLLSIRVDEPTLILNYVRIMDLSGRVLYSEPINLNLQEVEIPIKLSEGLFIFQMGYNDFHHYNQIFVVLDR